jgi:uracil-DNA glycosylase family 4
MELDDDLDVVVRGLGAQLRRLRDRRVAWVPAPVAVAAPPPSPAPVAVASAPSGARLTLAEVREELGECTRCKLASTRKNIVFGVGNPDAELVFIGEAPGNNEDIQGEPFVGDAGQLLTKMIGAMGYRREDVYIANILKCLRYNTPVLLENGSWERIGRLVRQRYGGRVMSVDEHGELVPKRVTGWYTSPLGDRRVYRLSYVSAKRVGALGTVGTTLTHDHEVMTRRGWVRAEQLAADDEVAVGHGLSEVAHDVVVGSLLGDGTLSRRSAYLAFIHSRDQDEYVRVKASALAELRPLVYPGVSRATKDGPSHLTTHARTRASRALRVLRSRFYPAGRKVVPPELRLTPRMLAIWFLDDGYTRVKSESCALAEIAAHGFTSEERARLVERLRGDLGVEAYLREPDRGRIHFGAAATVAVSRLIAPYCPRSMRYKLHPRARDVAFDAGLYTPGARTTLFDRVVVERVEPSGTDKTFFCIDVEDTHSFVTGGGVVHNCRPPGNRNPEPDEIESCEPFLKKQLAALRPKVIVALGKFAAQWLVGKPDAAISALRGRFHTYEGIKVMPTYHPAYLLRTPSAKRTVWEDLQLVMAELGRKPPA